MGLAAAEVVDGDRAVVVTEVTAGDASGGFFDVVVGSATVGSAEVECEGCFGVAAGGFWGRFGGDGSNVGRAGGVLEGVNGAE